MDNGEVNQAELLRRMDASFKAFDELLSRAIMQDVDAPGVSGKWSVKDIVAHLIAHEQRTAEELRWAKRGETLPVKHEENDSFNDGAVYAYRAAMFEIVRSQWRRSYEHVVDTIKELSDSDFDPQSEVVKLLDDTIDGAVANNTYAHYDEHAPQLEAWVKAQEDAEKEKKEKNEKKKAKKS